MFVELHDFPGSGKNKTSLKLAPRLHTFVLGKWKPQTKNIHKKNTVETSPPFWQDSMFDPFLFFGWGYSHFHTKTPHQTNPVCIQTKRHLFFVKSLALMPLFFPVSFSLSHVWILKTWPPPKPKKTNKCDPKIILRCADQNPEETYRRFSIPMKGILDATELGSSLPSLRTS